MMFTAIVSAALVVVQPTYYGPPPSGGVAQLVPIIPMAPMLPFLPLTPLAPMADVIRDTYVPSTYSPSRTYYNDYPITRTYDRPVVTRTYDRVYVDAPATCRPAPPTRPAPATRAPERLPEPREEPTVEPTALVSPDLEYVYENLKPVRSRGYVEGEIRLNGQSYEVWIPLLNGELPLIRAVVDNGQLVKLYCDFENARSYDGYMPIYERTPISLAPRTTADTPFEEEEEELPDRLPDPQ